MSGSHHPRPSPAPRSPIAIPTDDQVGPRKELGVHPPSTALRFLLVAYVGARWRRERARGTMRWRRGARALQSALDQLVDRERANASEVERSECRGQCLRNDIPHAAGGDDRNGEEEGGTA